MRRPPDKACPPATKRRSRPVARIPADEELAILAKALGHPARVRIVRLLLRTRTCRCGGIVAELPLAQPTVSQHLKVLREAGVIRGNVQGPCICYFIEPRALRRLRELVGRLKSSD